MQNWLREKKSLAGLHLWHVKVHVPLHPLCSNSNFLIPNQLPPPPLPPSPSLSTRTTCKNDDTQERQWGTMSSPSTTFGSKALTFTLHTVTWCPHTLPYFWHLVSSFSPFIFCITDISTFCTHTGIASHTGTASCADSPLWLGMSFSFLFSLNVLLT